MSGLDEQVKEPVLFIKSVNRDRYEAYEKWIYGYFDCQKCGYRIYHDIPFLERKRVTTGICSLDSMKQEYRTRIRMVYGIFGDKTDLKHIGCGGKIIYCDIDVVKYI